MPADGTSTCSAKASISGSGNISNVSVTFTASSISTFFHASNGVTVSADSKTATAQTGIDGLTPEVFFADNSNATIDITITASANGLTNATQPFHFTQKAIPLTFTLAAASDDNYLAAGNNQDKHSAIAALSPAKAQTVTFTLPSNQQATFSETDTSIYTVSPDKKTVSVTTNAQSGQTPIVHFTDANTAGEFVVLTVSTADAQDNQHSFAFGPFGQTAIILDKFIDNAFANGQDINAVEARITVNGNPPLFRTPITYQVTGSAFWKTNKQPTFNDIIHNNDGYSINGFYDTNTAGEIVSVTATCNGVTSDPLEFTFEPYHPHVTLTNRENGQYADGHSTNMVTAVVNINPGPNNNGTQAPDNTPVTFTVDGSASFTGGNPTTLKTSSGFVIAEFFDTNRNGENVTVTATCSGVPSNSLEFIFAPYQFHVELVTGVDDQPADGHSLNTVLGIVTINPGLVDASPPVPQDTPVTFTVSGSALFTNKEPTITLGTEGNFAIPDFYDTNSNGETVTVTATCEGVQSNSLDFTFAPYNTSPIILLPIIISYPQENETVIVPINIGQHGPVYAHGTATANQVLIFSINQQVIGNSTSDSSGNWTSPGISHIGSVTLSVSYASGGHSAPTSTVDFSVTTSGS